MKPVIPDYGWSIFGVRVKITVSRKVYGAKKLIFKWMGTIILVIKSISIAKFRCYIGISLFTSKISSLALLSFFVAKRNSSIS